MIVVKIELMTPFTSTNYTVTTSSRFLLFRCLTTKQLQQGLASCFQPSDSESYHCYPLMVGKGATVKGKNTKVCSCVTASKPKNRTK